MNIIGRCAEINKDDKCIFDIGLFFRNLLFYETFIFDSIRFTEFEYLVNSIGYGQTIQLLNHESLKIRCYACSLASVGQSGFNGKRTLPFGSYTFNSIQIHNQKEYVSRNLRNIEIIQGINIREKQKLKRLICENLVDETQDIPKKLNEQTHVDIIKHNPAIKNSIVSILEKEFKKRPPDDFQKVNVNFNLINDDSYKCETNICELFNIDQQQAHNIIERAIFANSIINQRVLEMDAFSALSGFKKEDIPIFKTKLNFLLKDKVTEFSDLNDNFTRVVEIAGLPTFESIGNTTKFNIDNFFKIKESSECEVFRQWLKLTPRLSEKELSEIINSLNARISDVLRSPLGITLRFLVSTAPGFIHPALGVAGALIGAVDMFLFNKVFPQNGPISFINKHYKSIFKQ